MFRFMQLALLFTAVSAFTQPTFVRRQIAVASPTARHILLSDEETANILKTADDCVHGECSIDDVGMLISELKDTEKELNSRLVKVTKMIQDLEHVNEKDERKTTEVKQFVKEMLSVFNHGKTGHYPIGFTGDIGDGPTTAYDALPPKKWVDPKKKKA
jgi:hypothetical protein